MEGIQRQFLIVLKLWCGFWTSCAVNFGVSLGFSFRVQFTLKFALIKQGFVSYWRREDVPFVISCFYANATGWFTTVEPVYSGHCISRSPPYNSCFKEFMRKTAIVLL